MAQVTVVESCLGEKVFVEAYDFGSEGVTKETVIEFCQNQILTTEGANPRNGRQDDERACNDLTCVHIDVNEKTKQVAFIVRVESSVFGRIFIVGVVT